MSLPHFKLNFTPSSGRDPRMNDFRSSMQEADPINKFRNRFIREHIIDV